MARIFTGGFESGDLVLDGWTNGQSNLGTGSGGGQQPSIVTGAVGNHRTLDGVNGGNFGCNLFTTAGSGVIWVDKTIPSNPADVYVRVCAHKSTTANASWPFLFLYDQTNTFIGSLRWNADVVNGLSLRNQGNALLVASNVSHTVTESATVWTRMEFHLTFSGGLCNLIQVRIEDTVWSEVTFTGFGPGGSTGLGEIRLHGPDNNQAGGNSGTVWYDDVAVNDASGTINNGFCGNGFIQGLTPSAAGTFTQLFNSAGNQTNNFSYVNTLPVTSNGTNAVGTSTPNQKDTYNVPDLPAPALGVNVVILSAYASKNGPSVSNANLVGVFNSTENDGSSFLLPIGAPNWLTRQLEVNPNTAVPFTRTDINGMEVGVKFTP